MRIARLQVVAAAAALLGVCAAGAATAAEPVPEPIAIPPSAQPEGDPDRGREYLLHGGYIGSGIPVQLWRAMTAFGPRPDPPIDRPGVDPTVPIDMNQYVSHRGVEVVSGVNCLGCHATSFRGEFVIGLGNTTKDWTSGQGVAAGTEQLAGLVLSNNAAALREAELFLEGAGKLRGTSAAPFRGVNPAFRLEEVSAAWRDPETLARLDEPVFEVGDRVIASDVPPLWNLRKKHALYYNGMGRGDFARLIQQIGMVLIEDADEAQAIQPGMRDLIAYLMTLEPPAYPEPIDRALAERGESIFHDRCASCHGTYGDHETYPNLLVPAGVVGTDPLYAETLRDSGLIDWFNESWFSRDGAAYARPEVAYVAPPLDGVWATAPYFHNASVPTLAGVLDSSTRPDRWTRSFSTDADAYDLDSVGWVHTTSDRAGPGVYDTARAGFGNAGHTFADDLDEADRRALLEYLKSL